MKSLETTNTEHFYKINMLADILTRSRNQCAANVEDDQYIEFNLFNVQEINAGHPDTFFIPGKEVLDLLKTGMLIKIFANWPDPDLIDERFWVRVTDITQLESGEVIYYGTAANDTAFVPYGSYMGPIRLSNICDVDLEEFIQSLKQSNPVTELSK